MVMGRRRGRREGLSHWSSLARWACLTLRCSLSSTNRLSLPSYHASHWVDIAFPWAGLCECRTVRGCVWVCVHVCVGFVLEARVWDYTASGKDSGVVEPWLRISSSYTLSLVTNLLDLKAKEESSEGLKCCDVTRRGTVEKVLLIFCSL